MTTKVQGRVARCSYCKKEVQSDTSLAFFQFQGEGSERATKQCAQCGYYKIAHGAINSLTGNAGITSHEFVPKGDVGHDDFYCGCRGWD